MIKGVLFDLDGVLLDSEDLYTAFWSSMEDMYPTGIADYALKIKGMALGAILKNYETEEVRNDIRRRLAEYECSIDYPAFPGAYATLEKLRTSGIKIALYTSSTNEKMLNVWKQHADLKAMFDVIVTSSMITHSKPDPEGYLLAARMLELKPEDCVVVEDSLQGVEAGRRSGAYVVGISTTNPAEALVGLADIVLPSVEGLYDCILKR
ncbi:MAG: HAD family phosphatase [Muribaculaceae bacterium]|nr:HAD family phosphatase [Muribaculaceae bacterium]